MKPMPLRRIIITGASGFVGRHLLYAFKEDFQIYGLARRSQARSEAPVHPNIRWFQADIADRRTIEAVFSQIAAEGGAEIVIHLAAHYDFTGEEHPEYYRTNVQGLRNILDLSRLVGTRRFIFSSSVAASALPTPGAALTETSLADGNHIYARTKRIGEDMLAEYRDVFPSVIVRFAALFSDWCEYPPLYMFLDTWLSSRWNRRILGGRGQSAIPYLHVKEVPRFFTCLLDRLPDLPPGQVVIASPDGAVSHLQLFEVANREYLIGNQVKPLFMPKRLCSAGIRARDLLGRVVGERPFERPWMAEYIDLRMTVNAGWSRRILGWEPRPRLEILRRMPFLIENLKMEPLEWNRRNHAAMKHINLRSNLQIHELLQKHEEEICDEFTRRLTGPDGRQRFPAYQHINPDQLGWNHKILLRNLMNAVRTRERAVFAAYCGDLAERRFLEGYPGQQVCDAIQMLNQICFWALLRDPEAAALKSDMIDDITLTLRAGCDRAQEVFEELETSSVRTRQRDSTWDWWLTGG
jgi:nucleoside-diphosphate-sugar epimerase